MKLIFCLIILLIVSSLQAQTAGQSQAAAVNLPPPTPFAVIRRDANSATWQQQTFQLGPKGTIVTNVHRYEEVSSGLNHLLNGQYVPSREDVEISPDGLSAAATNGQSQAYFPGDIYSGAIKLVTPNGQTLVSDPIGLAYFDGSNSVLLVAVTNSTGAILPSGNSVIYSNVFAGSGLDGDLIFSYTRSGFEQNVVLRSQPPDPASLGLNSAQTRLQMITEFVTVPQPTVTATTVQTEAGDLENDSLDFNSMAMVQGKAFLIGSNSPSVNVCKRWLTINGRQFLIEEVPIVSIAAAIDTLAPFTAQAGTGTKPVISRNLILPPQRLVHTSPKIQFLAKAQVPGRGLVLDYQIINSSLTNRTFQGDTTYFISGATYLYGTNTFEGGTVLKYTNGASITLESAPIWLTGPYRPVIFTARDDNTVGDTISGSTGSPTGYYASPALAIAYSTPQTNSNFRIAYARQAVSVSGNSAVGFYDGQVINSQSGLSLNSSTANLRNILFANLVTNFVETSTSTLDVQNATFNNVSYLVAEGANNALTMNVTNCVLANVTNLFAGTYTNAFSAGTNGFYNCPPIGAGQVTNISYPFQSVGAGNYYLSNSCAFINAGTTNIDQVLLADLQARTTYPPAFVYTNLTTNGVWVPQIQRDTNAAPALGYHYAPIDYAVSGVTVNGVLALNNGVALATFQAAAYASGFTVGAGDSLNSVGTALVHNQICHYAAVQEQPILWGGNPFNQAVCVIASSLTSPAVLYGRFTDFNGLAGLGTSALFAASSPGGVQIGGGDPIEFNLRDCRVGPGWLTCDTYQGTDANICFNNLFDRGGIVISDFDGDSPVTMQNNLFHNGYVYFDNELQTYIWTVENNFFDNVGSLSGSGLAADHNGYWSTTQLSGDVNDVVVTNFVYAKGPLGNYYQVSTNLLYAGSTAASALGLYHYTVQTNETVEGSSTVSIGFHYIATDAYGNPLDSNGDGIPDYLEDANGDGIYDAGDLGDWQGLNLNVIITRPRNGSVLP